MFIFCIIYKKNKNRNAKDMQMHLSNFIQHISFKLTTPYGMECAFKVRHVPAKKYFSNDTIMLNYFILLCTLKQYRFSLAINNLYWLEWKNLRHFKVDKVKNVDHFSMMVVHLTIIILKLYKIKMRPTNNFITIIITLHVQHHI